MSVLDPQQLVAHVARSTAPTRVVVHSTARGGITAEVIAVLSSDKTRVWTLRDVLLRIRATAEPAEINSILHKLVNGSKRALQTRVFNGVRDVNGYRWL